MKYLVIGILVLASGMLYFMYQSNKASAERLQHAEIAHQQKIEQEKIDAANAAKSAAEQKAQAELTRIKENEATQKAEQDKQQAQIELAAQKLKERLIDSDSAKFKNQKGNCGEVNSKNRMGGYTGYSRYIYDPANDTIMIESDSRNSIFTPQVMDALWLKSCG